ncbi:MFS transporter, partial [Gemmatimonas sp.]|uniref:MFS transporter n=1 Tax=Gemmatimonas sp. TaxID=1962908 RepID=UPI00334259D7
MSDSSASENSTPRVTPAQAWYAVAILTIANISGFVDRQILSLLVKPMRRDFGLTDTEISLLMGLSFTIFYSVLGLPIGRWVDRGARPRIIALGAAIWSLLTALTGFTRSFGQLFAARIGVGIGEATLGPAAVSIIADHFPRKRLATAMGVYQMGSFMGSGFAYAIGALIVGRLTAPGKITLPLGIEIFPWQTVFFWVGLPGLVVALLALTIREPRNEIRRVASSTPEATSIPLRDVLLYMRANVRTIGAISFGFACS